MTKQKRESPTEMLTKVSQPEIESLHIKVPRHAPIEVSKERGERQVAPDEKKIEEYLNQIGAKSYTKIHTHPAREEEYHAGAYGGHWSTTRTEYSFPGIAQTRPSMQDIYLFLKNDKTEFDMVAQQNPDGTITGIHVLKKQKKPSEQALSRRAELVSDESGQGWEYDPSETVQDVAKYFGLNYKFIPVSENHPANLKIKRKSLEQKVSAVVAISGLCASFFLLGSNVTGNAIGNLGKSSGSWLGIILFLVGIAGALVYFRSKKR